MVKVFRSKRREGTYLFVDAEERFTRVPETLVAHFGPAVEAMELELTAERRLANACAADVLASIAEKGFYLQLPPDVDPITGARRTP